MVQGRTETAKTRQDADPQDHTWGALRLFSSYRVLVAAVLLATAVVWGGEIIFGSRNLQLFLYASGGYLALGLLLYLAAGRRVPRFEYQLSVQVVADIVFVVVLTHASGGVQSGVGLLLLASLAAAGTVSRGQLTLFYAALATMGMLLEQTYGMIWDDATVSQYVQTGMLSIGYFATAGLAYALAKYARASERLAQERGIDLADLSQVNQLVIQDLYDGVVVLDADGQVRQRNAQADRLLGKPEDETREVRLEQWSGPLGESFSRWRRLGQQSPEMLRIPATNRVIRPRFVALDDDRSRGGVLFLEDMSRVQSRAQQLKLAALGRLTANIAHEIRNPLAAISHASELLREGGESAETRERLAKIIHDNTRRLDRLVHEVLQLNRRDRVAQERFPAGDFLSRFLEGFVQGERIPRSGFAVEVDEGTTICFDRAHLDQVLWNLCRNAWRHGQKRDGSVKILAAPGSTPNTTVIDVADDGPGIPEELRSRVFEPFFTTVGGGTGLGLYISREMCEANGAALEFLEADRGACFRITCRKDHVKAQRASDAIPL
jgi:two-component system sensor histidine kinase PilS (NtrC family)